MTKYPLHPKLIDAISEYKTAAKAALALSAAFSAAAFAFASASVAAYVPAAFAAVAAAACAFAAARASGACRRQGDTLLQLIKEAPITQEENS